MPIQERVKSERLEQPEQIYDRRKPRIFDIVEVLEDLPEYGVEKGERGAIVEILSQPQEAYILEFLDPSGIPSKLAYWVKPYQIRPVHMMRVCSTTITVSTHERTDLINLNYDISEFVGMTGIENGFVQVSSLHTTAGLFVNEWQDALLNDVKSMIERMVPRDTYYKHNDPEYSDSDRHNADSHLRSILLAHTLSIPLSEGQLVLGRWQSVILADFDGPNARKIFIQVFGI